MLVLKLNRDEVADLTLPDKSVISVMVTAAGCGWAKVGISAPPQVKILRRELVVRKGAKQG